MRRLLITSMSASRRISASTPARTKPVEGQTANIAKVVGLGLRAVLPQRREYLQCNSLNAICRRPHQSGKAFAPHAMPWPDMRFFCALCECTGSARQEENPRRKIFPQEGQFD